MYICQIKTKATTEKKGHRKPHGILRVKRWRKPQGRYRKTTVSDAVEQLLTCCLTGFQGSSKVHLEIRWHEVSPVREIEGANLPQGTPKVSGQSSCAVNKVLIGGCIRIQGRP